MSTELLNVLIVAPTALVIAALVVVMWRERRSRRGSFVAVLAAAFLTLWAGIICVLGLRGFFIPPDSERAPPVGIALAAILAGLALVLGISPTLRRLLTNQQNLIRLNVWRLVGIVFLVLMAYGQMPALWALPAGIGDIIVGATAFWVASRVHMADGIRRAIIFNLFGLVDLVVAVGLGVMTSRGPLQVFQTTPTSELATRFPLVLVPTFLVPLAFMLHIVSLWQLFGGRWADTRSAEQELRAS
jgi:hypothetical protein